MYKLLALLSLVLLFSLNYVNAQSVTPFDNCIYLYSKGLTVLLQVDNDCNEKQFSDAINYFKINGYPIESANYNYDGVKAVQLDTQKFLDFTK